ncbi:MAG: hypothetical protein BWY24_00800 [Microgenomates group bacterium ADurb.Bin219]|nr:MAG: hypothetical protein BWY24_00800 [Microgenomates group bacterium ADurb.Bin219]
MKKIIKIFLSLIITVFVFTTPAFAGELNIVLNQPPSMVNTTDFQIFYTAIETDQATIKVNLFIKKEGAADWKQTADKDKTDYSGKFQTRGEDFSGEGKYQFYAQAVSGATTKNSDTVELTLDTTAPGKVEDYRKERINATVFRLYFKCPADIDFEKVYIYRSKEISFTADSGTLVAEVGCAPGESKSREIGGDWDVDYYFALRALDHAGNASDVVTDAPGVVGAGQVAGATTGQTVKSGSSGTVVRLPKEGPTGDQDSEEEGELAGAGATEGEVKGENTPKSKWPYFLGGLGLILLVGAFYKLRKDQD